MTTGISSDVLFEAFIATHGGELGRLAHGLTGNRTEAEDLTQETLLRIHGSQRFREARVPVAFAKRVMINTHISACRRRAVANGKQNLLHEAPTRDVADRVADQDALRRALVGVNAKQRAAIVLRYLEDRPDSEIAEMLGVRQATVRSLVSRGLEELRKAMAKPSLTDHHSLARNHD